MGAMGQRYEMQVCSETHAATDRNNYVYYLAENTTYQTHHSNDFHHYYDYVKRFYMPYVFSNFKPICVS